MQVIVSGNQEPKGVEISDDALTDGAEALSAMLLEAQKDAHQQSVQVKFLLCPRFYHDLCRYFVGCMLRTYISPSFQKMEYIGTFFLHFVKLVQLL